MAILSIQSAVACGHVGNSAAVFLLQRLGFEVWRIDTVSLSNHPAHPTVRGRTVPADEVRALVLGIEALGALPRCEAVLSGYLGEPATAAVVLEAVRRIQTVRPGALYCCDPVMGDAEKGRYVAAELPAAFRERLVPAADVVTPNAFELGLLTGLPVGTEAEATAAARAVCGLGPRVVVVTGLADPAGRTLATIAVTPDGAWVARSARRDRPAYGAGDAFTAVFLAAYLRHRDAPRALGLAVSSLDAIFAATEALDAHDLAIVAAGDHVAAAREAPVERLR